MSAKKKQASRRDDGLHKISREEVEQMKQNPVIRIIKIILTIAFIGIVLYASGVFN